MRFFPGGRWLALVVAGLVWGCGDDEGERTRHDPVMPWCDLAGADACRSDRDCGSGFTCSESCCLPACETATECDAAACGPLGCVCDDGACRDRVCASAADCDEGQVCRAGACGAPAAPGEAARCEVAPRWAVLREDVALQLHVQAFDANGAPLLVSGGFAFRSDGPERVAVDEAGRLTGGTEAGTAVVEATIGAARCEMEVVNHQAPDPGELRVVVVDERTGLPVEGVLVQVETGAAPLTGTTDASGAVAFSAAAAGETATVSAFHEETTWTTVVDTAERDLLLPVRRMVRGFAGGFEGTFGPDRLFHPDNVQAGVAGASIPASLIDLDVARLVGPPEQVRVTIGGEHDVRIPSGVVLGLGNTWFKEEYRVLAEYGACDDREASAQGRCGTRTAWGVAGGVPLLDLPIDEIVEGGDSLEVGALLAQLLPQFQRFRSGVVRDVSFTLHPLDDGRPDFERFEQVDLQATQRMALRSTVRLPALPQVQGRWLDGAIVFGGAHVQGRGVVPLGLTAGIDADRAAGEAPDGRVNEAPGLSNGQLPLRIAPLHGGLEGSDYVVLALAANFEGLDGATCSEADRRGCTAVSGLLDRSADFSFDRTVDLTAGGFVAPAEGASWDPAARRFTLDELPAGDANVVRLRVDGADGGRWHVWMPARTGSVELPVPEGIGDRAAESRASVQALRLTVGLDDLVAFDENRLAELVERIGGFSTLDLP